MSKDFEEIPSEWARLILPYASAEAGAWFIPEVGDEVMVLFEQGNLDAPVVLGRLYNKKSPPPKSGKKGDLNENNQNDLKFIRTRSGHLLCFDDGPEATITLSDSSKRRLEIRSKENTVLLEDGSGTGVTLKEGKIEIKTQGGDKVTLAEGKVTIHGAKGIDLGEGASHPVAFGDNLLQMFNAHVHMTAWGPSSPPLTPLVPADISSKVRTV